MSMMFVVLFQLIVATIVVTAENIVLRVLRIAEVADQFAEMVPANQRRTVQIVLPIAEHVRFLPAAVPKIINAKNWNMPAQDAGPATEDATRTRISAWNAKAAANAFRDTRVKVITAKE